MGGSIYILAETFTIGKFSIMYCIIPLHQYTRAMMKDWKQGRILRFSKNMPSAQIHKISSIFYSLFLYGLLTLMGHYHRFPTNVSLHKRKWRWKIPQSIHELGSIVVSNKAYLGLTHWIILTYAIFRYRHVEKFLIRIFYHATMLPSLF